LRPRRKSICLGPWYCVTTVAAGRSMRLLLSPIHVSQPSPSSRRQFGGVGRRQRYSPRGWVSVVWGDVPATGGVSTTLAIRRSERHQFGCIATHHFGCSALFALPSLRRRRSAWARQAIKRACCFHYPCQPIRQPLSRAIDF
jgi:hypothetical protein